MPSNKIQFKQRFTVSDMFVTVSDVMFVTANEIFVSVSDIVVTASGIFFVTTSDMICWWHILVEQNV